MDKIMSIVCLLIWFGWMIYSIFGKTEMCLRVGLFTASLVCMTFYIQNILK